MEGDGLANVNGAGVFFGDLEQVNGVGFPEEHTLELP